MRSDTTPRPAAGSDSDLAFSLVDEARSIVLVHDRFDSEMLERPIGRIAEATASSAAGYSALLRRLMAAAREQGFVQVVRRTGAADRPEIWALNAAGFELMDVGLTFDRSAEGLGQPPLRDDIAVRPATDDDISRLAEGMSHLPWGSRYESDPTYTADQVRKLRTQWLWNSHRGRADVVLVGEIDGCPGSFATCVLDAGRREGDVELVGTLPSFRGRGAASHLVAHALTWLAPKADVITVRTQATNSTAARVYEKAGFTMRSCDLTLRCLVGEVPAS